MVFVTTLLLCYIVAVTFHLTSCSCSVVRGRVDSRCKCNAEAAYAALSECAGKTRQRILL